MRTINPHITLNTTATVRRAFTVMEAMVTMAIIVLLLGLVLAGIRHVRGSGDVASERAMVIALRNSCEQFQHEFGFPVPLVMDLPDPTNATTAQAPATLNGRIVVWSTADLANVDTRANASPGGPADKDRCLRQSFSQYSLPYYLCGSLDDLYDEVTGFGFTAPSPTHDGSFTMKGRKHEPLIDITQFKTRTGANRFHAPAAAYVNGNPASQQARAGQMWILYRGFAKSAIDAPIRYYRWLPAYYPKNSPKAGQVQYWNVPIAVGGDVEHPDVPPSRIEAKGAEWAVVSPGPDGLFGDEDILVITGELNRQGTFANTNEEYRRKAAADNIVEFGR